jgi:hypothetical protein
MMLRVLIFTTAILSICACGNKKNGAIPKDVLPVAKMEKVLWDVLRADAFVFEFVKKDSTKNAVLEIAKLQQQIFAAHKITKAVFDKSYTWYRSQPQLMQPMLDSLITIKTREKYQQTKGSTYGPPATVHGDSAKVAQ